MGLDKVTPEHRLAGVRGFFKSNPSVFHKPGHYALVIQPWTEQGQSVSPGADFF